VGEISAEQMARIRDLVDEEAQVLDKGLDTSTIQIRWSLGNEGAMPSED
jgi:hypothetical protein